MKQTNPMTAVAALGLVVAMMATGTAQAALFFGTGPNSFTIDFVDVGNPGNAAQSALNRSHGESGGDGYGAVSYSYRISTYEISKDMITKATASGMSNVAAGALTGNQPVNLIPWYEAAAFVNWLNTSKGYQPAYNLTFTTSWSMALWGAGDQASTGVGSGTNPYRHNDAYYFLPSEDEWYKAAYYNPAGSNYYLYATGSDTAPTPVASGISAGTAVYNGQSPADVNSSGGLSPYGTMGQGGNKWEWIESAFDGTNNSSSEDRAIRGGFAFGTEDYLRSSFRSNVGPTQTWGTIGFRVASVPDSSAVPEAGQVAASVVVLAGVGVYLMVRRRRPSAPGRAKKVVSPKKWSVPRFDAFLSSTNFK